MFGAGPPPPSPAEVKRQEIEARGAVKAALATCLVLYLSPFVVEYAYKFV